MSSGIADNIRDLRKARHWSQEMLAMAAGVDVRTVQRAEAGKTLAADSLKAIAAAFDTTIEALAIAPEDFAELIAEFREHYRIVDMHVSSGSADLGGLMNAAEALLLERVGDLTETQLDAFAEFEQDVRDYLDIWREIPVSSRRNGERILHEHVERLRASGVSVTFGTDRVLLRCGDGTTLPMSVLCIAASPIATPMLALVRNKRVGVSLA